MSNGDTNEGANSIVDLLMNFSSQISTQAALQVSMSQAEARFQRAQLEYNEVKPKWRGYPALEERKTADRDAARKDFKSKAEELNKHTASHQQLMGSLATLIGQAATPAKPSSAEFVSRAEFDKVQKNYEDLKKDVDATNDSMKTTGDDLAKVKSVADAASTQSSKTFKELDTVKLDSNALRGWKQDANTKLDKVNQLDNRLSEIWDHSNETRKILDNFKYYDVSRLATKAQSDTLETAQETLTQNVTGVQRKIADFTKEFGQFKAEKTAALLNQQAPTKSQAANPEVLQKLDKMSAEGAELKEKIAKMSTDNAEFKKTIEQTVDEVPQFKEKVNALLSKGEDLLGVVEALQEDMKNVFEDIKALDANVIEEGKEPIIRRVKNLDMLVNNLSTKVETYTKVPALLQRVGQLEQGHEALQKTVQTTKASPQAQVTASGSLDLKPLTAQLTALDNKLKDLQDQQQDKDDMVAGEFENVRTFVEAQIDAVTRGHLQSMDEWNKIITNITTKFETFQALVGTKADSEALESVKGEVSTLGEELKKIQTEHRRAKSTSQTPTPAQQGLPPHQPPSFAAGSPSLPNGVAASPQVNGVQQPPQHYASPNVNNMAQPQPQEAGRMQQDVRGLQEDAHRLQMQLNQLIGVTQHLKQRIDNVQTDEVVRSMADQMSHMYPHAKNFDATARDIKVAYRELDSRVNELQKQKDAAVRNLNAACSSSDKKAEAAAKAAEIFSNDLNKGLHQLSDSVQYSKDRAENLQNQISELKNTVTKLNGSVDSHETIMQYGNDEIKAVSKEHKKLKEDIDAMATTIGENVGKIAALEGV